MKILDLLLFYLVLFSVVAAQDKNNFNSLMGGITSVIFIVVFIIILLAVGGVLKRPSVGIPGFLILFIILVITLFIIPVFVPYPRYLEIPENFKMAPLPSYATQAFIMLGLPSDWMYVPAIIYLFILPFAAIYTLVWAFLQSLGIFSNVSSSINRVLAFIIAFLTIPMGWFVKLVWVLFSFMGASSVVIFVATFVVGIFFRGLAISGREFEEYKKFVLRSKKEAQEIIKDLETAKQGTLDVMKKTIKDNIDKVGVIDKRAERILNAALISDDPNEVRKLISEAQDQLRKTSQ